MICPHCNDPLRHDRRLNAYFCIDCDYVVYAEKRRPTKTGNLGATRRPGRRVRRNAVSVG